MTGPSEVRGGSSGHVDISDLADVPMALQPEAAEVLRGEYEHIAASFLANEEAGDRRVDAFLTVIAIVIAGIGLAADTLLPATQLATVVVVAAFFLLLYGIATLGRIAKRNLTTTDHLNGLRRMRAVFLRQYPGLLTALPLVPGAFHERRRDAWSLPAGGLLEVVAITNCMLAAVAIAAALQYLGLGWAATIGLALVTFLGMWVSQMVWVQRAYEMGSTRSKTDRDHALEAWRHVFDGRSFRAGAGIVVQDRSGQVLAVQRTTPVGAWQLPQGGLEPGESAVQAAWRELGEEIGLTPSHVELVDSTDLWLGYELPAELRSPKHGRGQVHRWFLFLLKADVTPTFRHDDVEVAALAWMSIDDLLTKTVEFRRPVYRHLKEWIEGRQHGPLERSVADGLNTPQRAPQALRNY